MFVGLSVILHLKCKAEYCWHFERLIFVIIAGNPPFFYLAIHYLKNYGGLGRYPLGKAFCLYLSPMA
ncbi:hypothetical protein VCRA2113O325_40421 [Vibrio crassostreae]|nr:hypothetical protein VCRA2113O322_140023 [Vibrio crassostreae]CAK2580940.1 hypothetical protein VCRA2113O323_150110 [Vibrio crassostreae]CAK2984634.1 hypothetical protein VCRA2113O325_40421 [Vibrio crassostreae]